MTQHEELAALRFLEDKQKALIEEQKTRREEKDRIIENQNIQIENVIQVLLHARKKMFDPSTEVGSQAEGRRSLFESVQGLAKALGLEQKKITVKTYVRTPRQAGICAEILAILPWDVVEYVILEADRCSICGEKMKTAGKKLVRTEVDFISARLRVTYVM